MFPQGHPGKGVNPTPNSGESGGSKTPTEGGGKVGCNLPAMNEGNPKAGVPSLFYCKPVNDKGGGLVMPLIPIIAVGACCN